MANKKIRLLFLVDSNDKNIQWLTQCFGEEYYDCSALGMNSSRKNITVSWRRIILYYKYILWNNGLIFNMQLHLFASLA